MLKTRGEMKMMNLETEAAAITGDVTLNDEPIKQRLFKFVEKKISQWAQTHLPPEELPKAADGMKFHVSFMEEEDGGQVSCETEIQLGSHIWIGSDWASDTQSALMHSLKRLHSN
jgi:hypothetical protein